MSEVEERLGNEPTSELWGEHRSRYRFAARFIRPGNRVLDVACGTGFGLTMLSNAGVQPVGIDYDGATLRAISANTQAAPVARGDATRLPLQSASFDHVVSFETVEHVPDAQALIAEVRRVLKPGGSLILSTPNRACGPPERHTANRFHVREFTADELRLALCEQFASVRLFGQRPSSHYRYVPFLMYVPRYTPDAVAWKLMLRLPYALRNSLALALSGRSFYPSENDYCFEPDATDGAHALVAVAQ